MSWRIFVRFLVAENAHGDLEQLPELDESRHPSRSARRRSARCTKRRPRGVRRGVANGAESRQSGRRSKGAARQGEGGFQGEPVRIISHARSYSKRMVSGLRARLLLASPKRRVRPPRSIYTSKSAVA